MLESFQDVPGRFQSHFWKLRMTPAQKSCFSSYEAVSTVESIHGWGKHGNHDFVRRAVSRRSRVFQNLFSENKCFLESPSTLGRKQIKREQFRRHWCRCIQIYIHKKIVLRAESLLVSPSALGRKQIKREQFRRHWCRCIQIYIHKKSSWGPNLYWCHHQP